MSTELKNDLTWSSPLSTLLGRMEFTAVEINDMVRRFLVKGGHRSDIEKICPFNEAFYKSTLF